MSTTLFVVAKNPRDMFARLSEHPDLDIQECEAAAGIAAAYPLVGTKECPVFGFDAQSSVSKCHLQGTSVEFAIGDFNAGQPTEIKVGRVTRGPRQHRL